MTTPNHQDHVVNLELLKIAKSTMGGFGGPSVKRAFVPGGDPSQGGAPAAGGDPSQGGGAPPAMDPGAMSGGGGGGGGMDAVMQQLQMMQNQIQQLQMGGGAGPGPGAGGGMGKNPLAPKIDEKVVQLQILKTLARMCDHFGIQVPMSDMVPGMTDMSQLAQASQGQAPMPGQGGSPGGGAAGDAAGGAIPPVDPMQGMQPAGQPGMAGADPTKQGSYRANGQPFDTNGLVETHNKAAAIAKFRKARKAS
jgi:hypothetical protein